ncbi:hypothetical protein Hypma_010317 [Hypsizygus marmoreus]|uniref:Uncharacterized protein n=1 Tax=Hypsizygus marmoreus TaxID=39966 RepID=A0A369JKC4_HYPMA|nr:hypothetical protein Hypma_010317 [Hypsizygus marmoreus]
MQGAFLANRHTPALIHSTPRCPHQRDICRNRTLHPRIDVSYLKNAEVDSFNGCGYCKWARTGPPPKQAGFFNPGWPGCCRAPGASEYKLIQPADWRSVSIVHQVPIPSEVKAALESLGTRGSPILTSPSAGRIATGVKASTDRRSSGNSSPSRSPSITGKPPSSISGRPRTGSPKQLHNSLNSSLSRSSSTTAISSSVPTASTMEQIHQRRQSGEKRVEGSHSSHSSPKRKNVDLDASVTPKRSSSTKGPSLTPSTTSVSLSKVVADGRSQGSPSSERRRASVSTSNPPPSKASPPPPKLVERPVSFVIPRSSKKDGDLSSASSSSGSSDGVGSMTDSTVTSDGGFTDYLSDESEAELQRQAEARAALVAQNQAEELEFKAARQQLAHIDLRPPKSWNSTNITNNTTSRLPGGSGTAYTPRSAPMPMAHAAQTRI